MDVSSVLTIVEIVVGAAVCILIGDFLGSRVGRVKLAIAMGIIILIAIVAWGVYAGIAAVKG